MSFQRITVVGNIGNDAEVRQTKNAKAIGFSLAANRSYVDADGVVNSQTTWFNCTKWVYADGSTEVAKYLKQGTLILVEGEISTHAYKKDNGEWGASLDLKVTDLKLLSSKKDD
jgi:single-strand DNA-binding protein